jgi:hypothetical protein
MIYHTQHEGYLSLGNALRTVAKNASVEIELSGNSEKLKKRF